VHKNISTKLITVNDIPEAGFSASVASGYAPLNVSFDGSFSTDSDDGITSYNWQFGDGSISNGQTISHIYQFPGTYTAILT
jgi:PKD repeat protein